MMGAYFRKMAGSSQSPPGVGLEEIFWSWLGAFLGIGAVAYMNYGWLDQTGLLLLIGSFGASAVLIYGAIKSPLAQPRNLLGGHVISALIGVTVFKLLAPHLWLAAAGTFAVTMGTRQTMGLFLSPLNTSTGLGLGSISLAFATDSWAEVYDGSGKAVLYDLGRAGTQRSIAAAAPLSVTIGNAPGVSINVNGRPASVPTVPGGGTVARFRIEADGTVR